MSGNSGGRDSGHSAAWWAKPHALIYTAGTVAGLAQGRDELRRTLAVHMYVLPPARGLHVPEGSATAVVLLVIVVGMNALSSYVAKKLTRG